MNAEAEVLPVRTLHPLGRFVWQLAGAVISSSGIIIVFSLLWRHLLELLLLSFTIGLPAVIGFIWVRVVTLKRVEVYSPRRFNVSVFSTFLSFLALPVIAYRSTLPKYFSEDEMRTFYSRHGDDLEKLVELHRLNPKLQLNLSNSEKSSTDLANVDQGVRSILVNLFKSKSVLELNSEQNPLRISLSLKVPRKLPFMYVDQSLVYLDKLDPDDLVVADNVPILEKRREHRGAYKRIGGSWYMFVHEHGD